VLITPDGKHAKAATQVEGPAGPFISVARYVAPKWPASLPCHKHADSRRDRFAAATPW